MAKFEVTPDALIRSAHVEEYATKVTKVVLSKMVVDSGYDDMEFLAVRYLGYSKSQGATFLAMSYDDNEEEFIVGLVYVNEEGVDFSGVPEFMGEDRRKADAFYSHYGEDGPAPQPVREAGPQRTEDPRFFYSQEELEDMFPGIADRAVRWDPDTWSDETKNFAEDRGEHVPELMEALATINKRVIDEAVETATDYALDNETDDYDYEGLDGKLINEESGLLDGLSDLQAEALIYLAHFVYEEFDSGQHGEEVDEDDEDDEKEEVKTNLHKSDRGFMSDFSAGYTLWEIAGQEVEIQGHGGTKNIQGEKYFCYYDDKNNEYWINEDQDTFILNGIKRHKGE